MEEVDIEPEGQHQTLTYTEDLIRTASTNPYNFSCYAVLSTLLRWNEWVPVCTAYNIVYQQLHVKTSQLHFVECSRETKTNRYSRGAKLGQIQGGLQW